MAISDFQKENLNNMCISAKSAQIGTLIQDLQNTGGSSYVLPAATTTVIGGVKKAAVQADSDATDVAGLVTDFNALLAKLRVAGILAE